MKAVDGMGHSTSCLDPTTRSWKRLRFAVLAVIVLVLSPSAGRAQWQLDGVPVSTATMIQSSPTIVSDGAGGAIVAWEDTRDGATDIYAQRVDDLGVAQWTVNGVAICTAAGSQIDPEITSDGAGGAIVVWNDILGIYAQRVSASGGVLWTVNGIAVQAHLADEISPQVIADGVGGAFVTWVDYRSSNPTNIYAQRVNASGMVQWVTDGVPLCTATGSQWYPRIVIDGGGGAIVTWHDRRSGYAIYAQRVNGSGVTQWTTDGVLVSTEADPSTQPKIASDGANGAIVTWDNDDIYAQRVNALGVSEWVANGTVICGLSGAQRRPEIVLDGVGGAIVTWDDQRPLANNFDIYAQRVSGAGVAQWTPDGVAVCSDVSAQSSPKITVDGAGGAIVTWADTRNFAPIDVYAQRISASGAVQWATDGVAVCTATGTQQGLVIAAAGFGGAIVAWADPRDGSYDIYAQRAPETVTSVGDTPSIAQLVVLQNHPNPFSGTTEFEIGLLKASDLSIEIFDVAGRRVRTLSAGQQSDGWRTVLFDGRNEIGQPLPGGVYFYKVTAHGISMSKKMVIAR